MRLCIGGGIFSVPSENTGKGFVSELSLLFRAHAEGSELESIALEASTVMSALLLQKPHSSSKFRDSITCLERSLHDWKSGNITNLLQEGRTIQRRIPKYCQDVLIVHVPRASDYRVYMRARPILLLRKKYQYYYLHVLSTAPNEADD